MARHDHDESRGRRRRARSIPSRAPHRGRAARDVPACDETSDIAWAPTLVRAAIRVAASGRDGAEDRGPPHADSLALAVSSPDLRRWWRTHRPGRLVLFVVDASGSMGEALVAVARRLALRVLEDAYVRRDRVALIAFRGTRAELLFGPAARPERLERALRDLSFGGTTPLGAALDRAQRTLTARARPRGSRELVLLITDGRGNVGRAPGLRAVRGEIARHARALAARPELETLLLDATERDDDDRPARRLADLLNARRVRLWRLREAGDPLASIWDEL